MQQPTSFCILFSIFHQNIFEVTLTHTYPPHTHTHSFKDSCRVFNQPNRWPRREGGLKDRKYILPLSGTHDPVTHTHTTHPHFKTHLFLPPQQLASAVPMDVMPGADDPSNYTLPQQVRLLSAPPSLPPSLPSALQFFPPSQPIHPCLLPHAARYPPPSTPFLTPMKPGPETTYSLLTYPPSLPPSLPPSPSTPASSRTPPATPPPSTQFLTLTRPG